jgi:hypothetical protein
MKMQLELDAILINYQESHNPLFVWEAFQYCRDYGKEIPDWIFEYLENVASNLLSLSKRDKMSSQRAAAEVYDVLGMSKFKPRDIFDRFALYKRNQNIVRRICNLIEDKKKKVTHAMEAVSEELELEYGTVRKIFYDWLNDGIYTKDKTARYGLPENVLPPPDCLHPEND